MKIKLDKTAVKKLFEDNDHQFQVIEGLYRMVYPDYDDIEKLEGWPTITENTNRDISRLFINFDRKHHPNVFNGGLWMNNGFSQMCAGEFDLEDWEVETSTGKPRYKLDSDDADRLMAGDSNYGK